MEQTDLIGMFMLGLLGTGHCIGMCGPLILAFPGRTERFMPHIWYHLGRVTTYTALGGILGGIGQLLTAASGSVAAIKVALWLLAAVLLLLFGLTRLGLLGEPGWLVALSPARIPGFQNALQGATVNGRQTVFFFLGVLLGFLPCGLSYGAFAQALGTGHAMQGALMVLAFGGGTMPGLILLGTGASAIFGRYRKQSDIFSGVIMILMALQMGFKALRMLSG